jgi:SAM-dependent methyltransferase
MKIIDDRKSQELTSLVSASSSMDIFDEMVDDTKRHFEMLSTSLHLLTSIRPDSILTIGDAYGRDASFFKRRLGSHVTASDLDLDKLRFAKNSGFIDNFLKLDAENLSLEANSIDVVVAKETFHHWTRPMVGFYEMLRVAKLGVLFIEPHDVQHLNQSQFPENASYYDDYEEVGNFIYRMSIREVLKASWSLYIDRVFIKGFNDPWSPDIPFDDWIREKNILDQMGIRGER